MRDTNLVSITLILYISSVKILGAISANLEMAENVKLQQFEQPTHNSDLILDEKPAKSSLKSRTRRGSFLSRSSLESECVEGNCTPEEYLEGAENYLSRTKMWKNEKFSRSMFKLYYSDCMVKCNKKRPTSTDIIVCQQYLTTKTGYMVFIDFDGNSRNNGVPMKTYGTEVLREKSRRNREGNSQPVTEVPIKHEIPKTVTDGISLKKLSSQNLYKSSQLKAWGRLNFGALCALGFEKHNNGMYTNWDGPKQAGWTKAFAKSVRKVEREFRDQKVCFFSYDPLRDDECKKLERNRHCKNSKIYNSRCKNRPKDSVNARKLDDLVERITKEKKN